MNTRLLFVYGSLRAGQSQHGLLSSSVFVGADRTVPEYALVSLGDYPALIPGGRTAVSGELYLVPETAFPALDAYEGEAYARTAITLASGRTAEAYLYREVLTDPLFVLSGDWLATRED